MREYFADPEEAKLFDCVEAIRLCKTVPPGLVDLGTLDEKIDQLQFDLLIATLEEGGHSNVECRWQEGYNHGLCFVQSVVRDHIEFHAKHLN